MRSDQSDARDQAPSGRFGTVSAGLWDIGAWTLVGHWSLVIGHFLVLFSFASSALALPGTLRTTDGQSLRGDVLIVAGGFSVTPAGRPAQIVELSRVALVQMDAPRNQDDPVVRAGLRGNGLLGTYFAKPDLSGRAMHRRDETIDFSWSDAAPMPGLPADHFSVRWTGKLEVPLDGDYTFFAQCDDGARLWIDGQKLVDEWRLCHGEEFQARRTLRAGRKYDFKLEHFERDGTALMKLSWDGPRFRRCIVPKECFSTTSPLATNAPPTAASPGALFVNRHGVLLRDGSFLAWNVGRVDEDKVVLTGGKEMFIPVSSVARIHFFWKLSPVLFARLQSRRPGVLMNNGDFVEGEVKSVAGKRVTVSSVLFGLRTFDGESKVAAVILREAVPSLCRWEVKLRNSSRLRVDALESGKAGLTIQDGLLRGLKINVWELDELRRQSESRTR